MANGPAHRARHTGEVPLQDRAFLVFFRRFIAVTLLVGPKDEHYGKLGIEVHDVQFYFSSFDDRRRTCKLFSTDQAYVSRRRTGDELSSLRPQRHISDLRFALPAIGFD
jgi:hypothetical protein